MENMRDLARLLASLDRRVQSLESSNGLGRSSFDQGGITQYHPLTGKPVLRVGTLPDGTFGVASQNGATPPVPATPTVTAVGSVLRVQWAGTTREGLPLPLDLARVEIVAQGAVVGLLSPSGGYATVTLPAPSPVVVRLVTWSGASADSDPATP